MPIYINVNVDGGMAIFRAMGVMGLPIHIRHFRHFHVRVIDVYVILGSNFVQGHRICVYSIYFYVTALAILAGFHFKVHDIEARNEGDVNLLEEIQDLLLEVGTNIFVQKVEEGTLKQGFRLEMEDINVRRVSLVFNVKAVCDIDRQKVLKGIIGIV